MNRLQVIKDESLRDGKGIIAHIDNFNWLAEQAGKVAVIRELVNGKGDTETISVSQLWDILNK